MRAKLHAAAVAVTYDIKDPEDIAAQARQFFLTQSPLPLGGCQPISMAQRPLAFLWSKGDGREIGQWYD